MGSLEALTLAVHEPERFALTAEPLTTRAVAWMERGALS